MTISKYFCALSGCLLVIVISGVADAEYTQKVRVDFGQDIGQNFGTLFEAVDVQGTVVAGAGFAGSYNTQSRSDRRSLHFFIKSRREPEFKPLPLPRPTTDAGTYLFDYDSRLFSKGRGGKDPKLRYWDGDAHQWKVDDKTAAYSVRIGKRVLSSDTRGVYFDGQPLLILKPDDGALAERYYANGALVFRRFDVKAKPPVNELVACRWTNTQTEPVTLDGGRTIAMGTPREFVYAYGQVQDGNLQGQIVAATNTGGLYVFNGHTWKTILEPDTKVSFQIYAMINYGNRLLMGQYPTGELFSYDGNELAHLPGWPPAMPGVSKNAREAQTLTIYGGDLYAGVWPWGEVWKYGGLPIDWKFQQRMFTHPKTTAKTTHPYEEETKKLGAVLNQWGQRVTSLVPLGDTLFISTSSKGGNPYEPKFTFLAKNKWKEYGAVYAHRQLGALVVPTTWPDGPTTFEFRVHQGKMTVSQDGKILGSANAPQEPTGSLAESIVHWGQGTFGPFRGKALQKD